MKAVSQSPNKRCNSKDVLSEEWEAFQDPLIAEKPRALAGKVSALFSLGAGFFFRSRNIQYRW